MNATSEITRGQFHLSKYCGNRMYLFSDSKAGKRKTWRVVHNSVPPIAGDHWTRYSTLGGARNAITEMVEKQTLHLL